MAGRIIHGRQEFYSDRKDLGLGLPHAVVQRGDVTFTEEQYPSNNTLGDAHANNMCHGR